MTVRANKPGFNIREKLKELTHSIGLKGRELMRAATVQEARDLVSAGRKNMVINGDMRIHQRGGTTQNSDGYGVDRFVGNAAGLDEFVATFSQSTDSPDGFSNSLKVEVDTAETSVASTGEYFRIQQRIEAQNLQHLGFGSASAKSITASFWVKSNIPGAYAFHIWMQDTNELVNSLYYINTADTWEYKTFTFSGNTGGAIANDNGQGFVLNWVLSAGSDYTAESGLGANWDVYNSGSHFAAGHNVNFCGSTSNEFYLTGVQLEVGKNATEFEHRSYGEELALCQRYYYQSRQRGRRGGGLFSQNSNRAQGRIYLPVTMRQSPTFGSTANYRDGIFANTTVSAANGYADAERVDSVDVEIDVDITGGSGNGGTWDFTFTFDAEF